MSETRYHMDYYSPFTRWGTGETGLRVWECEEGHPAFGRQEVAVKVEEYGTGGCFLTVDGKDPDEVMRVYEEKKAALVAREKDRRSA